MDTLEKSWICTDNDCLQYRLAEGNSKYRFIQTLKIDETYRVVASTINTKEYSREELEKEIQPFYNSIANMEKDYGKPLDELMEIVAECIFENIVFLDKYDYCSIPTSWENARKIIESYTGQKIQN